MLTKLEELDITEDDITFSTTFFEKKSQRLFSEGESAPIVPLHATQCHAKERHIASYKHETTTEAKGLRDETDFSEQEPKNEAVLCETETSVDLERNNGKHSKDQPDGSTILETTNFYLEILSNWGHEDMVGLTEVKLFLLTHILLTEKILL